MIMLTGFNIVITTGQQHVKNVTVAKNFITTCTLAYIIRERDTVKILTYNKRIYNIFQTW